MQYYECECGKSKSFGSMSPGNCKPCEHCGTILWNVRWKKELRPDPDEHEWTTQYEGVTKTPYKFCFKCRTARPFEVGEEI